jgi:regulatory protein
MFLDGKFVFALETEAVVKEGLKVGQELSTDRIDSLLASLHISRCLDAAYRYLGYRPRSEVEIRERLNRRGFPAEHIDTVITKLKEKGLLDDADFARFWKENRESFKPLSRRATSRELKQKGVSEEIISEVVSEIDEGESAYRAAISRVSRLSKLDYEQFRRKLGEYLRYRGFGYSVINQTIKRVWQEIKEAG